MTGGWWFMALFYPHYLVGGIPTPLKNMKVSWDDYSQYMENKKCFSSERHAAELGHATAADHMRLRLLSNWKEHHLTP